jgi:hypothetical protein
MVSPWPSARLTQCRVQQSSPHQPLLWLPIEQNMRPGTIIVRPLDVSIPWNDGTCPRVTPSAASASKMSPNNVPTLHEGIVRLSTVRLDLHDWCQKLALQWTRFKRNSWRRWNRYSRCTKYCRNFKIFSVVELLDQLIKKTCTIIRFRQKCKNPAHLALNT